MEKSKIKNLLYLLVPLLFLVYSSPSALEYLFFFPDEKYYTDSVLQMMEKDDCLTPYQADGAPRFKKPIVTYWVLMASYKLFGVSRISSRLFFWLAGAALVMITYFMALSVSRNKKLALTAAFITAANPLVLMSASRSIPDILLVLFLTVSAWGFLEIMLREKVLKKYYWMAYLGAALAFETKGFPAAAFAGASMLFLLVNPWRRIKLRKIIDPLSMGVAVVIALSWFVAMYVLHGSEYWSLFFADQVGDRVSSKSVQVLRNTFLGVVNLLAFFLPWVLLFFSKPRQLKDFVQKQNHPHKAVFGFVLVWVVLIIIMSGAVFKFYDRYLLPVVPLASLVLAWVFVETQVSFKKTILNVLLVLNVIVILIGITFSIFILTNGALIAGIGVAILLIGLYYLNIYRNISTEMYIANAVALLYFNLFVLLFPLLTPNSGSQLVANLENAGVTKNDEVFVYGNIRTAASMRIYSNNECNIIGMDTVYVLPQSKNHYLVFNQKEMALLDLSNYDVIEGSQEWKRISVDKSPAFLQEVIRGVKQKGSKYYIAKPK
ncbi:glycosyltransferase family 39 protein [uncultured Draconibacterium sp.]|uniref:ArnT family glycosyltransferase n=1 Tax=uncultured Draconibacterium sp. TaxID=1573823 RepID=UPI003217C634